MHGLVAWFLIHQNPHIILPTDIGHDFSIYFIPFSVFHLSRHKQNIKDRPICGCLHESLCIGSQHFGIGHGRQDRGMRSRVPLRCFVVFAATSAKRHLSEEA